ncbi:MAG: tRNA epoxyqueuosine(34) reductase QueG [Gammaproteobacteria bacterium]|jgi:epoxyqueuosine reductase|nr:tRNA epoxyqueuosine(34) reductase QueG [Gammaproteobacteria bacterium]
MDNARQLPADLTRQIVAWGRELGFQQVGITDIDLAQAEDRLERWLAAGYHGEMDYMARHGNRRSRPAELIANTCSVISTRMDYLPMDQADAAAVLDSKNLGYIARYALGRDYHKVMRRRLQKFADRITQAIGTFGYRVFVDSAPVLEKPLAEKAGLGWIGKHTNIINKEAGSWFLLGEIYTDLPLSSSSPAINHCGTCNTCIDVCPTQAFIAPYQLDARRCISYLTIELSGPIPLGFRKAIGNHIFGCDDCQLYCPWNKFAHLTTEPDFAPRHGLDASNLIELFAWSLEEWETRLAGSPLRRAGYAGWLRNIAVALGNAKTSPTVISALNTRREDPSELVQEHVNWALTQHDAL